MDKNTAQSFDAVLERVRDPESNLPVSQLGIISRFRYSEEEKTIYGVTGYASHGPGCLTCTRISAAIEHGINRRLREELQQEFPGFSVEFVPA